jgi:pimeloyl-ACP methyl ester carboxylesterase
LLLGATSHLAHVEVGSKAPAYNPTMHVEHLGDGGPRVLLVHGGIVPGWQTWEAQRPLAEHYRLVVPHRPGYPPNAPGEGVDFASQARAIADLIEPDTHLVGHSYGGVIALLAAALVPEQVRSLTVIEPPAFGLVRGEPSVEELIGRLDPLFANDALSAREFFLLFAAVVGATPRLPEVLPPETEASIAASRLEPLPWQATIPLDAMAAIGRPTLVFSGGHNAAFDAVCDFIAERLDGERVVIAGRGHSVQRTGEPFNTRLRSFIDAASQSAHPLR